MHTQCIVQTCHTIVLYNNYAYTVHSTNVHSPPSSQQKHVRGHLLAFMLLPPSESSTFPSKKDLIVAAYGMHVKHFSALLSHIYLSLEASTWS